MTGDEQEEDTQNSVYAALLAALDRDVLHAHCDAFMCGKLAQTQRCVEDAAVALQRLRDVMLASQKLQNGEEPLHVQLKPLAKLRRKVARAFKRASGVVEGEGTANGHGARADTTGDARAKPRVQVKAEQAGFEFGMGDADSTAEAAVEESHQLQPVSEEVGRGREQSSVLLSSSAVNVGDSMEKPNSPLDVETRVEKPQHVQHIQIQSRITKEPELPVADPAPVTSVTQANEPPGDAVQTPQNRKRQREDPVNGEVHDPSHTLDAETRPESWELSEALRKLNEHSPNCEFVTLVHNEIRIPDDFQKRDLASQVDAIRALSEGVKALSAAPICKLGPEITLRQRLMVAAVIVEAVHFFTTFVVKQLTSSEPPLDANELFAMLECLSSTMGVFKDSKVTLNRLRQSGRDLASYVQSTYENEFQDWDTERKLTMSKRRQFDNIRATLESWTQSEKCRGSTLDRLMDQFERLLTNSLALWDVTKDEVIRACVEQMATVVLVVDGSIEKLAARAGKLNAFRNILSNEVPPTTRAIRARNSQMRRDDASA